MVQIFKWEWRYCRSSAWKQLMIQACYPTAIFLLYCFHKEWLFQTASAVLSLPKEIYVFTGLNHNVTTGNIRFYVFFGVMIIQAWMAWNACCRTLELLQADERTGSICFICNQWYSRRQLGMGKLLSSSVVFLAQNTLWYSIVLFFTLLGSVNADQRVTALKAIFLLWIRTSFVTGMLIILTFCMGVFLRNSIRKGASWVSAFLLISLMLGNLYKIRDMVLWLMESLELHYANILEKLEWLDWGYWLSPLSWLNPYTDITVGMMLIQGGICIIISVLGVWSGLAGYGQRKIAGGVAV
mgnify:CR=1 FL=1